MISYNKTATITKELANQPEKVYSHIRAEMIDVLLERFRKNNFANCTFRIVTALKGELKDKYIIQYYLPQKDKTVEEMIKEETYHPFAELTIQIIINED